MSSVNHGIVIRMTKITTEYMKKYHNLLQYLPNFFLCHKHFLFKDSTFVSVFLIILFVVSQALRRKLHHCLSL
jgi:hypothetical protein